MILVQQVVELNPPSKDYVGTILAAVTTLEAAIAMVAAVDFIAITVDML